MHMQLSYASTMGNNICIKQINKKALKYYAPNIYTHRAYAVNIHASHSFAKYYEIYYFISLLPKLICVDNPH